MIVLKRNALDELIKWKNEVDREPLILNGARQVGKTWLMKEFAKKHFDSFVYFNFDEQDDIKEIFAVNKSAERIIERLSLISGIAIEPQKTLIIFDEIQECSDALNSLKYFNESNKKYFVISAGSLLGTLLSQPKSYPVGQVNIIKIEPLSFDEFLRATDEKLYEFYIKIKKDSFIEKIFHNRLVEVYQNYLIIGGLPECVQSWIKYKDPKKVHQIQGEIIKLYENDFSKHSGKVNSARILMVFRNIVTQLAKENKKFIYSKIQKGARAREFEEAIEWLISAGIINRVYLSSKNGYPLKTYDDLNAFKLYLFDTGLLKYMAGIENESIVLNKDFPFKGVLAENFVLQQIKNNFIVEPRYFTFDRYEIDYLIQIKDRIIPVEVKAGDAVNSKSIKAYEIKFSPEICVRYSLLNYKKDGKIKNIPLYLANKTEELI